VANQLRDEFSLRTVQEAISGERTLVMSEVARNVNNSTLEEFGVEIIDIRIKQLDWQTDVRESVFARMRSERSRDASEHRARGAQRSGGEGDAGSAAIYAGAYNRDPEFFRFDRSLQPYRETLASEKDLLVLEPDSDFFRYLKRSGAR